MHRLVFQDRRPLLRLAVAVLLVSQPVAPAVIVVSGGCTLPDAITAANTDTATGSCPAGSGADEIRLTADVTLTQVDSSGADGDNGLPSVTSDMTFEGGDFAITRDDAAPDFRILHVEVGGTLGINRTTVSNGRASGEGFLAIGGGILNRGSLTLHRSTVAGNWAATDEGSGGGIYNSGTLALYDSTVKDNIAFAYLGPGGGGILNAGGGTVLLVGTTISNNSASVEYTSGGGLWGDGLTLINSTVSGNAAVYGGAISGSGVIVNTTIADNVSHGGDGDSYAVIRGSLTLYNSILGRNGLNCGFAMPDGGGNFDDDGSCGPGFQHLVGLEALLADNGGPTLTHALQEDSSAIDGAGDCGLETDQRGSERIGPCDSGAFEFGGTSFELSTTVCPGPATITASGATPLALVHLYEGPAQGPSGVPDGLCMGTRLKIDSPTEIAVFSVDEGGSGSTVVDFEASDCGQLLQALDIENCGTSTVEEIDSCNPLTLVHTGLGDDPTAVPANSLGCVAGEYLPMESIELTAHPDPSWDVESWSGTDDDSSMDLVNTFSMPPSAHEVAVNYEQACFSLTLGHVGSGLDPVASPPGSPECPAGLFHVGEVVGLSASPDAEWEVGGWTGSDDDSSTETTNTVTMPQADHDLTVEYIESCYELTASHTGAGADPGAVPLGHATRWTRLVVDPDINGPVSVLASDINGDGSMDVLVAANSGDEVAWWEFTPQGAESWTKHLIAGELDGVGSVQSADFDRDGDLDVVGAVFFDDEILWWENLQGDGATWTEHLIRAEFDTAESVHTGDLDGDGDSDVLGASVQGDEVTWWENSLGDGKGWIEHPIDAAFDGASTVEATDLDGDGDLDVLGAAASIASDVEEIAWWENNLGNGTDWTKRTIDNELPIAAGAIGSDIDGDGDLDVVGWTEGGDEVSWWENVPGDGTSWLKHVVDNEINLPFSIDAEDLDGDGDIDLVGASGLGNLLTWWENSLGDGSVWSEHPIDSSFFSARVVHAADMDGDGSTDVLGARTETGSGEIHLFVNTYTGICSPGEFRAADLLSLSADPDVGWVVDGWNGTLDDDSKALVNLAVMPSSSFAVSVDYVEDPCVAADGDTLVLEMETLFGIEVYEVCSTIDARNDFVVAGPNGDLTLRAGSGVVFGNDFEVTEGGKLAVDIDSGLEPPVSPRRP